MGNCLVTQLKGSVNNDSLPVLNGWTAKITIPADIGTDMYYNRFALNASVPFTVKASGSKNIYAYAGGVGHLAGDNLGSEVQSRLSGSVYSVYLCFPEPGEYYITVISKYEITNIAFLPEYLSVKTSDMKYMPLASISLEYVSDYYDVDLADIPDSVTSLKLYGARGRMHTIKGTTLDLARLVNLTSLDIRVLSAEGDIAELGALTDLSSLALNYTNIHGNIEDFVKAMVRNGVLTKSITVAMMQNQPALFYKGIVVAVSSSTTLSWEPSSTTGKTSITFNGESTEIDND